MTPWKLHSPHPSVNLTGRKTRILTSPYLRRTRRSPVTDVGFAKRPGRSVGAPDLEVGERHERADVLVGIAKRLAAQLDPGVREKLTTGAADANSHHRPVDPTPLQHPGQRHGANETLRAKHAESGRTDQRERHLSRFRQPRRVRLDARADRTGE
jgi:hypothetical protein